MRRRDEGSEQIRTLLDQDSERLTQDLVDLLGALEASTDLPYGIPSQTAFDAIDDTRLVYADLIAQIQAIETTSPAKADVISALDVMDLGFGSYAKGLRTGVSRRGQRRLKSAVKVLERANEDLMSARSRL